MRYREKCIYGLNRVSEWELLDLFGDILLYLLLNARGNGFVSYVEKSIKYPYLKCALSEVEPLCVVAEITLQLLMKATRIRFCHNL